MRSKNKEIRDHHAKMYIDAVFGDTLKQEGFISPDDKSFSWFRVVNNELVHAVYFHATWPYLPLMGLKIESQVFPLFCKPYYYSTIYSGCSNRHIGYRVMSIEDLPDENGHRCMAPYSSEIQVMACTSGKHGLYTLETKVLPWFQRAMTAADYYRLAAGEYPDSSIMFAEFLLPEISALCVLQEDTEKYAFYSERIELELLRYRDELIRDNLIAAKMVMDGGDRDAFLARLEMQKQKNIKWLKKMGILV